MTYYLITCYAFGIGFTIVKWLKEDYEDGYEDLVAILFSPILTPVVIFILIVNTLTKEK